MKKTGITKYLLNCFLFIVPVLIWNIAFRDLLPVAFTFNVFWADLPPVIQWGEHFFRLFVYLMPLLMPIRIYFRKQKIGVIVYIIGLFIYFLSWRPLVLYPDSFWSTSLIGFTAPAYTPLLFLIGIGLIGNSMYFNIPYRRRYYYMVAFAFTFFHTWHTSLLYYSLHP